MIFLAWKMHQGKLWLLVQDVSFILYSHCVDVVVGKSSRICNSRNAHDTLACVALMAKLPVCAFFVNVSGQLYQVFV